MKLKLYIIVSLAHSGFSNAATIYATEIPNGDYTVTPYSTLDGQMTLSMSSGTWSTGTAAIPDAFGGASGGSNDNAFDLVDGATMSLTFSADSGLREISSRWTRATITITGFTADPGLSVSGGSGSRTATYSGGTVTLNQVWNAGTVVTYEFADYTASAGQTLTFTTSGDPGSQFAVNQITYDVIPEPSSLALLALGGLALVRRRR